MAVRTVFLLRYIIDMTLREQITATTNKIESYNGFVDWVRFGGEGVISNNNPVEQEKRVKHAQIVANAIILHNAVDMTIAINKLLSEGYKISKSDIAALSPYITRHIKRFGDYCVDITVIPEPIQREILLSGLVKEKAGF